MADPNDLAGRIQLSTALPVRALADPVESLDVAIQAALTPGARHSVITTTAGGYQVVTTGPDQNLSAPPVAAVAVPDAVAVAVNGGQRLYVSSDPAGSLRWVDVPGLRAFYRLPEGDRDQARNRWADRLARVEPGLGQTAARALPIPLLRVRLARQAAAAFGVVRVDRGDPAVDAGGVVNGVSLPILRLPLREPDCYLPVIAQVEGKLESINAWDAGAGVSLGVIQFNADRGALFRFLWQFWLDDPNLFASALTGPLGWTMAWDGDHADLFVGEARLHGRGADKARNAAFLQTGELDGTGRNGPYRREVAAALRDCLAWPHVQDIVVDTSAWYLQAALDSIHAEGIGPLDPEAPDRATFVLTGLLLSGAVRYSGCLKRLLVALREWPEVADKLAHWQEALATTSAPCPSLLTRLKVQRPQADQVYEQVLRLLD